MISRDVRLDLEELYAAADCARRRKTELAKRLKRNSYEGKPGMLESVLREHELAERLENLFRHNHSQAARQFARNAGLITEETSATKSSDLSPRGDSA